MRSLTAGYNGDTFARFRLCSTASTCNTPTGEALDGEVEDYQFELINQIVLSGFVFEDNGVGGATAAHDGVFDGSEEGIGNVVVRAIYNGTGAGGYATGDVVATTITSGDGGYLLVVPVSLADEDLILEVVKQADWIDISESDVSALTQITNSSVVDSQMLVNAAAGDYLTGLNFGKVKEPRMEPDNFTESEPGKGVLFSHKFTAETAGSVNFTVMNISAEPANDGWSAILYQDNDCNGVIDGADSQIVNPVAVSGDSSICLISKVFVPANTPLNALYHYDIQADMTFEDSTSTGHGVTRQVIDTDTVRATFSGAGELILSKAVKNITQGGAEVISNQAMPGDVLEYTIYFTNNGGGDINTIKLFDAVPEYTVLTETVSCTAPATSLPASIVSCNVLTADGTNDAGYEGGIEWQLGGTLVPAERGYVTYRVVVE